MKKLAVFAVAAVMAASAMANYGFYDESSSVLKIGSYEGAWAGWNQANDFNNPLGTLSDLTITQVSFNIWDENRDRQGANLLLTLWDGGQEPVGTADYHLGAVTKIEGDNNNYSLNNTGSFDVLAAMNKTTDDLVDGKTYYMDVQLKTYNGQEGGDQYLPQAGQHADDKYCDGKFHTQFTYSASTPAVPEPATMSLLGLGALAMVLRRKLRK